MLAALIATAAGERPLAEMATPLELATLVPAAASWEVELGFGKGHHLLARAAAEPGGGFVGVEVASKYYRRVRDRAWRRGLGNLVLMRGEALYLMSVYLPRERFCAAHVYFPDPWPKSRHHKRRLLDAETVDLVVGLLEPGGVLFFATDHEEYGDQVEVLLRSHPGLGVAAVGSPWPGGARTNYERKYGTEGRPILRLEARRLVPAGGELLHPAGAARVVSGFGGG